jgi:hypothetical protein
MLINIVLKHIEMKQMVNSCWWGYPDSISGKFTPIKGKEIHNKAN